MTDTSQHLRIFVVPEHVRNTGASLEEVAIRSAVVEPTGETGASGYPRYAGGGLVADVDTKGPTVETLLADGAELDYGLTAVAAFVE
jgi:hypothetical protein